MTENEILKDLQNYQGILKAKTRINAGVNPEIALNAVTEAIDVIQQYRAIGTVEELQSKLEAYRELGTMEELKTLKEKNTPKKFEYQIGKNGLKHEKCPGCGSFSVFGNYCSWCGQKIDWGKGE